jgi:HK97 family phage major capsid protein
MAAIAEELVERATRGDRSRSSFQEFRSRGGGAQVVVTDPAQAFWKYLTAPAAPIMTSDPAFADTGAAEVLFEESELRVLSKATSAAGGYLVPQDFDEMVTATRRAQGVIGELARLIETDHGRPIPLGTATAHGTAAWTAENAAVTATDETFGQVALNAYKGMTKVIVSEELAQDAIDNFDEYLADELGQRIAALEEPAFATGDGTGKPLGITTSGNGVTVVTAATGSATGLLPTAQTPPGSCRPPPSPRSPG